MPKLPKPLHRIALSLLLLAGAGVTAAAPAVAAQNAATVAPTTGNRYRIFHLDLHAAELLAWEQCTQKERCQVTGATSDGVSSIDLHADAATHERFARVLAREDAAPRTQIFQVMLLEAATAGAAEAPADLAAGARQALADLQAFLPFKSYRLLDNAWLRATSNVVGRLVGTGGVSYEVGLHFRRVGDSKSDQLFVSSFRLREEGDAVLVNEKGERRAPRMLLNTSFDLSAGETIVVGTSRVDGTDKALVILLTAVGEPSA